MVTKSLCIAAMTFAMATTAHTAALRTFVSGFGSDGNTSTNCSHAQPCRTFAAAVTVTASGGEIEALDPAGYGPITISGPLTLVGVPGAAINVPSGGAGITVNAPPLTSVHITGLLIDGGGSGTTGIQINGAGTVVVENCVIRNVTNDGINLYNTVSTVELFVSNTLVADNGYYGIFVFPKGNVSVYATFNRVEASHNAYNILLEADQASGTVTGTAFGSVSVGSLVGFETYGPATLNLLHSIASNNTDGVYASGGTIRLDQSMVTGNFSGWRTDNGGSVLSYVNNSIDGNSSNEAPPPTLGVK